MPETQDNNQSRENDFDFKEGGSPGLTKREYIAAQPMQGILSDVHVQLWLKTDPRFTGENFAAVVAINACEFTDALINQLNK